MIKDWELSIIGEELTKLLGQGVEAGKIALMRRLVDDYQALLSDRGVISQDMVGLINHLSSNAHPHRCPDCVHITHKIQVRVSRR